jgi:hypothetical protein
MIANLFTQIDSSSRHLNIEIIIKSSAVPVSLIKWEAKKKKKKYLFFKS